jgi:hypothetical protein
VDVAVVSVPAGSNHASMNMSLLDPSPAGTPGMTGSIALPAPRPDHWTPSGET